MLKIIRFFSGLSSGRARLLPPAFAGICLILLTGCAGPAYLEGGYSGYSGPYYDNGYPGPYGGPYYGDYGPYENDVIIGGGGYYGGHHFYGHSFGHGGGFHGGGYRGGGGGRGGGHRR